MLVLLAGGILGWQRPWRDEPSREAVASLPVDAPARLTAQLRSWGSATSEREFVAVAGDSDRARVLASRTWTSLRAVGATDVSFRYVSGGDVSDRADGSARAIAEVAWRPGPEAGLGPARLQRTSVVLRVRPRPGGTLAIEGVEPRTSALPIWLAGEVAVSHTEGVTVLTLDGGDPDLPVQDLAVTARRQVRRTLPDAAGDVVVVSPRTRRQTARLLGQDKSQVEQVAAVTTRLDRGGSGAATSGAVIVLNPALFATMDRRAAQVVLTHEATHLLTGAVGSRAESWVVEGFADYVALRDDSAPLSVSAGQILAQVRAGDVPEQLPDAASFDTAGRGLGAVYESAWLVFQVLAADHRPADLVAFYDDVMAGASVDTALRDRLDTSTRRLTRAWRDYLTKSASTVS